MSDSVRLKAVGATPIKSTGLATKKNRSLPKALFHAAIGMGGLTAAVLLVTIPTKDIKTRLQLLEGLDQDGTTELKRSPSSTNLRSKIRSLDMWAEFTRIIGVYGVRSLLSKQTDLDPRMSHVLSTLLVASATAPLEKKRMEKRVHLYRDEAEVNPSIPVKLNAVPSKYAAGSLQSIVDSALPFVLYETLVSIMSEYLVRPTAKDLVRNNFTFIRKDGVHETDIWSDFLAQAFVRCLTLPLETMAKKKLSGTETVVNSADVKTQQKRTRALVKSILLTIPQASTNIFMLYLYRAGGMLSDALGL